jgi:hypothetical protein
MELSFCELPETTMSRYFMPWTASLRLPSTFNQSHLGAETEYVDAQPADVWQSTVVWMLFQSRPQRTEKLGPLCHRLPILL